jgi:O-antigen/teichoic acid export membrane protein
LQAAYFILLARLLGVREYGIFAGAFAFVSIAMPYSSLGSGLLFVRYVSADSREFAQYWGNILLSTIGVGALITALLYFIAPHLLNPESASLILLVALAECVCRQLTICIGQIFQAYERLRVTAGVALLTSFLRLVAVAMVILFLRRATAWQWALASLLATILAAIVSATLVLTRLGSPTFSPRLFRMRLSEGFNFSFAGSTQSAYNDIDKTMLSHFSMNVANGIYTMAYRIIDIANLPIAALDAAALPRYFRQSREGAASVKALSFRLAGRTALFGLVMAAILLLGAPLIPCILGYGFRDSVTALRWLCLIPIFRGVHQLTGSAVTGMGYQHYRTRAQIGVAILNLALNIWLIPKHGWLGAAWASLVTDGTLAAANWSILRSLRHGFMEVSTA